MEWAGSNTKSSIIIKCGLAVRMNSEFKVSVIILSFSEAQSSVWSSDWLCSSIFRWEPGFLRIPPQSLCLLKEGNQYSCTFILKRSDLLCTSLLPHLDGTFWGTRLIFSSLEVNLRGQTLLCEIEFGLIHLLCGPINLFTFLISITSPVKVLILFLLQKKQILTSANCNYFLDFFPWNLPCMYMIFLTWRGNNTELFLW